MRVYESTIAFHPELGESALEDLLERAKQAIAAEGGEVARVFDWGLRDLAYPIRKQHRATFQIIEFKGNGRAVAELERNLRIFDSVLRYITVQVDPDRPPLDLHRARRELSGEGGSPEMGLDVGEMEPTQEEGFSAVGEPGDLQEDPERS